MQPSDGECYRYGRGNMTRHFALFLAVLLSACGPAANAPNSNEENNEESPNMFLKIENDVFVSPQISLADIAAAKEQGITVIVNNRPDGEEPSAAQGADIEAAAKAAGMSYISIPISHAGFSRPQIDAMREQLDQMANDGGKMLAYCRSGTRSTLLWSLAEAAKGESPRVIAAKAADAGYDVSPISMMLDTLAGAAGQ